MVDGTKDHNSEKTRRKNRRKAYAKWVALYATAIGSAGLGTELLEHGLQPSEVYSYLHDGGIDGSLQALTTWFLDGTAFTLHGLGTILFSVLSIGLFGLAFVKPRSVLFVYTLGLVSFIAFFGYSEIVQVFPKDSTPQVMHGVGIAGVLAFVLLLGPRLCYAAFRFAIDETSRPLPSTLKPLPSQQQFVDRLSDVIRRSPLDRSRLIGLSGEWGSGKSTILRLLSDELSRDQGDGVRWKVITFDTWRHEAARSEELALFRTICDDGSLLFECWTWLLRPFYRMLLPGFGHSLKLTFPGVSWLSADLDMSAPEVRWREQLRRLIARLGRDHVRVVLIMDEVDRCSPRAAQRYLTLTRRFLDVPGLITVVPYVRPQIRFKVFNPSIGCLPELRSTMMAVLHQVYQKPLEIVTSKNALGPAPGAQPQDGLDVRLPRSPLLNAMVQNLEQYFLAMPPGPQKELIAVMFEEKFFGAMPLNMPRPGPADVAAMLDTFSSIHGALGLSATPEEHAEELEELKNQIRTWCMRLEVESIQASGLQEGGTPGSSIRPRRSLRQFEGALFEALSEVMSIQPRATPARKLRRMAVWLGLRRVYLGHI
ncbi:MAG: AAA family ATPase [Alphaproteobacteria bacterium]|nr:AAA family ATPase [Alphaproteobacteria bacterium]